jgi:hypothetical protein
MAVRLSDGDAVRAAGGQWVGTEGGAERKEEEGGQEAQDGWLTTVEEGQQVVKLTTHGVPRSLKGGPFHIFQTGSELNILV